MKKCPRCLELKLSDHDAAENAISRRDNQTYICSDCGNEEAFIDAGLYNYLNIRIVTTRELRFQESLNK